LHLSHLLLLRSCLGARRLQLLGLLLVGFLRYASSQDQCGERDDARRRGEIYPPWLRLQIDSFGRANFARALALGGQAFAEIFIFGKKVDF
jgi:hypothetical protein